MNWGALGGGVAGFVLLVILVLGFGWVAPYWTGGVFVLVPTAIGGLAYPLIRYR